MPALSSSGSFFFPMLGYERKPKNSSLRFCPCPFINNALSKRILPSKHHPKNNHHHMQPQNQKKLLPSNLDLPLSLFPLVADLKKPFRIIGDHAVQVAFDAPPHHGILVDGPGQNGPARGFGVAEEFVADGPHEDFLEDVEGDVGDGEELAGVRDGKPDEADGISGEVFVA